MWLTVGLEDFTGDSSLVGRLRTFLDVFADDFPTAAGHLRNMLDHVLVRRCQVPCALKFKVKMKSVYIECDQSGVELL
jgi:hypothetical protein